MPFWVYGRGSATGQRDRFFSTAATSDGASREAFLNGLIPERIEESFEAAAAETRTVEQRLIDVEHTLTRMQPREGIGTWLLTFGQGMSVLAAMLAPVGTWMAIEQLNASAGPAGVDPLRYVLAGLYGLIATTWAAAMFVVFTRAKRIGPSRDDE